MNNLFSHLFDNLVSNQLFTSQDVPINFEHKIIERAQGSLELKSKAYQLTNYGELRIVSIHSQKINIINCFFYPFAQWHLPIYAMEFVSLGTKPIVGVLDLPCLSGKERSSAKSLMNELLVKYQIEQSNDYPIWYQECRSNYDIFTRPSDHNVFDRLSSAHQDIINSLPIFAENTHKLADTDYSKHKHKIREYQHHHLVNSPGLPLMNNMFGEEWTQSFLKEWLFAELN